MPSHTYGVALRHTDGHTNFIEDCDVSDKYTDFIASHLDGMKEQCNHFTTCINKLLQDENPVHVLRGEDISLNKTCGLVYQSGSSDYQTLSGRCTVEGRGYIREDIELHLKDKFLESWNNVENCLTNHYGDAERQPSKIDEICGMAYEQPTFCNRYKIHKTVETFFNEQIHHLRCTCQNLNKVEDDHSHMPMYIAVACGGVVLLLVIAIIVFCCYRRQRSKRKKRSPNIIYLPAPNSDNNPVYQEVCDDRIYRPSPNPPTLPMRYTPHPLSGTNLSRLEDENAYLEPVEPGSMYRPKLPPMRGAPVSNPGYGDPPKYSERAEDVPKNRDSDADNGYFEPLPPPPPPPDEDGGYDSLGRSKKGNNPTPSGYETVESMAPAPPKPAGGQPLGPVPAKRTKKDDKQAESPYFVLEKEEHSEV